MNSELSQEVIERFLHNPVNLGYAIATLETVARTGQKNPLLSYFYHLKESEYAN